MYGIKTTCTCIECFGKGIFSFIERIGIPEEKKLEAVKEVLAMLSGADYTLPPPLHADKCYQILTPYGNGIKDPFKKEKDRSTECAWQLLEEIREKLAAFPDPWEGALRLAIAGNIIDFGVNTNFNIDDAKKLVSDALNMPLDQEAMELLHRKMEEAANILYIVDNCGEAVFDSYFIRLYSSRITVAVRGKPTLNDVTMEEAAASGLTNAASRVIDTGDSVPGVWLPYTSAEFRKAFDEADFCIAKGQGNLETLRGCGKPIFFLFRAKCPVVARNAGNVEIGSCQIRHENI